MKIIAFFFALVSFSVFSQNSVYYIIKEGNTTSLKECFFSSGIHETRLVFPSNLNDFVSLTYDCENNVFYTIGNSQYGVKSNLIKINASSWTIEDLGNIHVFGPNQTLVSNNICQVEGLAYNHADDKLYATLSTVCLDYYSTNFVTLDLDFSPNFVRGDIVGETQGQYDELDWMAFSYNNLMQSKIYGANVVPQSNLSMVQTTSFSGSSAGQLSTIQQYNDDELFRGLTYITTQDSFYTLGMNQNTLWLRRFKLSPNAQSISCTNVVNFTGITYNEVRGLSFRRESCLTEIPLSIEENQPITEKESQEIQITLYPNPTEGVTNFKTESDEVIYEILVFDSQGKQAFQANVQEINARKIDLSNLEEGVYLVRVIFQSGQTQIIRLVKN